MKNSRRIVALLVCLVMAFTMFVMQSFAAAPVLCDVNSDGAVNAKDVLRLKQHLAQWKVDIDADCSDCNRDNAVNAKDLLIIRQALANIISIPTFAASTTAGTTATRPTGLPAGIPADYVNEVSNVPAIDQIGYQTDSEKTVKFRLPDDFTSKTFTVYLYSINEGKVVLSGETDRRSFYDTMQHYTSNFDFSSIKTNGVYRLYAPFGYSYDINIVTNPYKKLEDAMINALYYNRCGCALDEKIVGAAYVHDACHTGDARVNFLTLFDNDLGYYTNNKQYGKAKDFSGGLHDAGDYGRYTEPACATAADLMYAVQLFPKATDFNILTDKANENVPDALDEARYEIEWLLKMQDKTSGGVYNRLCTNAFAGYYDAPDKDQTFDYHGLWMSRPSVKSTIESAGVYAAAYTTFKNIDLDFATRCLSASKAALKYADENYDKRKDVVTGSSEGNAMAAGPYDSTDVDCDFWWTANALFRATGETVYKERVQKLYDEKQAATRSFNLTSMGTYASGGYGSVELLLNENSDATLKAEAIQAFVDLAKSSSYASNSRKDKYNSLIVQGCYYWGSNGQIATKMKVLALADYFSNTNLYEQILRNNISFICGRNSYSKCFITGFGSDSPQNPHHRPSMIAKRNKTGDNAPGWVVAGIEGYKYLDSIDSYSTNEVAIYWNSSPILAFASVIERDLAK